MKLSREQFDVLVATIDLPKASKCELQSEIGYSTETIDKILSELTELGLVSDGCITQKGYEALEPYEAKRALFIAAGFGSRMVPATLTQPKPMVSVNGKRIIDTLIDAVLAAGIHY